MVRNIIKIIEEKCDGCGICIDACHEGALALVNGKAVLTRDDYCDGLGDCLPLCPRDAILIEERKALPFDAEAVKKNQELKAKETLACGCPGEMVQSITPSANQTTNKQNLAAKPLESHLTQWPVQIKLLPPNASFFNGANLLVAADCTAYAYANFHEDFIKNHVTIIGCPKLDMEDYSEKLTEILRLNEVKSIKVVRMEVPCCGGIEYAVKQALQNSGKMIPWQIITVSTDGKILEN